MARDQDVYTEGDNDDDDEEEEDEGAEVSTPEPTDPVPRILPSEVWDHGFVNEVIERIFLAKVATEKVPGKKGKPDGTLSYLDVSFTADEIGKLLALGRKSLMRQKMIVRIPEKELPLTVVGDIHSNIIHLRRIFHTNGWPGDGHSYLLLGDYIDRGTQGIETVCLLLALQYRYPTRVHMLRGNHEEANTTLNYGFYEECITKFPTGNQGYQIWRNFIQTFDCLPVCALVGNKIACMHGGLSPHMNRLQDVEAIQRPTTIPAYGLLCDITWSDPEEQLQGWKMSKRWVGFAFGADVVEQFCRQEGLDLIIRAHQIDKNMYQAGYRWMKRAPLITVFSSMNYQNAHNNAAVVKITSKMRIYFVVYKCRTWQKTKQDPDKQGGCCE